MAELSLIFRRIVNESVEESHNELAYNEEMYDYPNLLTQESGVNNQDFSYFSNNNMQYSYISDQSNNVYYNLINKLKNKIDYFETSDCEIDYTPNSEYLDLYENINSNVQNIKKSISSQLDNLQNAEADYNNCINKIKQMNTTLSSLQNIQYDDCLQSEIIKKTQDEFIEKLDIFIDSINNDNKIETLHQNYKKELKIFQKYITLGKMISEVQQIPTCILCMERIPTYTFQCGHVCCEECCAKLKNGKCHTCRGPIDKKIKLFLWN